MVSVKRRVKKKTLLGYELTHHQDAWVNYLVPSVGACVVYTFLIASDIATFVSHYRNGDPIWGSLTLFFMYLPVLASFIIIISNWELWPEFEGCGRNNVIWFWIKVLEHLFFPVWSMWRYDGEFFLIIMHLVILIALGISDIICQWFKTLAILKKSSRVNTYISNRFLRN